MDKNLDPIAKELFGKIRTQFPKIQLGNADSKVTDRPEDARFFEFDFVVNGKNLGTVSVSISNDDGMVVMYSTSIVDDQPDGVKHLWFKFLKELREFARARLLNFDARDISKNNLEKRDYEQLAKNSGEGTMTESKLWGTSKTSFQEMGEAKLIVKHSQPVNYDLPAGRTMHIESIFIENAEGERFKYPFKHLNGARALATHVAHGGTSYDDIGQHIIGLSEELSKLRMFKGYVDRHPMVAEAMDTVNAKVYERIDQIKKEIAGLQRPTYYSAFAESFSKREEKNIPEDVVNDWIDRLTIRSFNEELKNVFPYIYKLVGEEVAPVKELTAEDLVSEEVCPTCGMDPCNCDHSEEKEVKEFADFQSYIDQLVGEESNLLNVDDETQSGAIEQLNQLMSQEMPAGVDGTNATQSLKGIIDDPELIDALKEIGKVNPEMDVRDLVKGFLEKYDEQNGTDIASKINFGAEAPAPTAEPAPPAAPTEPAPAAAPAAPVAESAFAKAVRKAATAGMQLEDTFSINGKSFTLKDAIEKAGLKVGDFFTEAVDKEQAEIVEFIKSMYDEQTGSFPKGETGVMIAVEKQFGEEATKLAQHVISELSTIYEANELRRLAGLPLLEFGITDIAQGVGKGLGAVQGAWQGAKDSVAKGWQDTKDAFAKGQASGQAAGQAALGPGSKYPTTPDEIKAFQAANGLKVDGIIGKNTQAALDKAGIKAPTAVAAKPAAGAAAKPAAPTTGGTTTNTSTNTQVSGTLKMGKPDGPITYNGKTVNPGDPEYAAASQALIQSQQRAQQARTQMATRGAGTGGTITQSPTFGDRDWQESIERMRKLASIK